jgi:hypothetical protein
MLRIDITIQYINDEVCQYLFVLSSASHLQSAGFCAVNIITENIRNSIIVFVAFILQIVSKPDGHLCVVLILEDG